jgi:hypothetical protein
MDNADFDWPDAQADNVSQLKEKFQRRFPVIVDQSIGDDWEYAGWCIRRGSRSELLLSSPGSKGRTRREFS